MKLLLQSSMIFFGTLLAAGLLALGEPEASQARMRAARSAQTVSDSLSWARVWNAEERGPAEPAR